MRYDQSITSLTSWLQSHPPCQWAQFHRHFFKKWNSCHQTYQANRL